MKYLQNAVRHRGNQPGDRFVKVSIDTIRDWAYTPEALQVYLLLVSHRGDGTYGESVNSVAERYGWTWRRANRAVDELKDARLAVIADGSWFVAVSEPFSPAEWAQMTSAKTAEPTSVETAEVPPSKRHKEPVPKQQNTEEQPEEQTEDQSEEQRNNQVISFSYVSKGDPCASCGRQLDDDCSGRYCSMECTISGFAAQNAAEAV